MSRFTFSAPRVGVLLESAHRFPLSALCAMGFAALAIIHNHESFLSTTLWNALLYALFAGFMVSLAVGLVGEGKGWRLVKTLAVSAVFFALLAVWFWVVGLELGLPHTLLGFALLGACVLSPFACGAGNDALWSFNQRSFTGFGLAAIAVGLFQIGLTAIFYALSQLFETRDGEWFTDATMIVMAVFWPLYTLTFVPRLPLSEEDKTPRLVAPLAFVLSYVALPVFLVYGAVIAVYGVEVLVLGHQPKGSVGWMVMGFAAAGILLHFLLYPLRERGAIVVRLYQRHFFVVLLPYLALLFWAVGLRVMNYGLTENRILALVGGAWAVGVVAVSLKKVRLALAPTVLSVLLLVMSGTVEKIGFESQFARLQSTIAHFNLPLQNGEFYPNKKITLTWEDRKDLSSLLDYFDDRRDGRMLPLNYLPGKSAVEIMKAWGLNYVSRWDSEERGDTRNITFSSHILNNDEPFTITGYDQIQRFNVYTGVAAASPAAADERKAVVTSFLSGTALVLEDRQSKVQTRIDLQALLNQPLEQLGGETTQDAPLMTDVILGSKRIRILVERVNFQKTKDEAWQVDSAYGYLLVNLPD